LGAREIVWLKQNPLSNRNKLRTRDLLCDLKRKVGINALLFPLTR
jgi:hypothetical protein